MIVSLALLDISVLKVRGRLYLAFLAHMQITPAQGPRGYSEVMCFCKARSQDFLLVPRALQDFFAVDMALYFLCLVVLGIIRHLEKLTVQCVLLDFSVNQTLLA